MFGVLIYKSGNLLLMKWFLNSAAARLKIGPLFKFIKIYLFSAYKYVQGSLLDN